MNLQVVLVPLTVAFFLAFLTESLVEYFLGKPFDQFEKLQPFKWLLKYVAAVVGIALSFYYEVDLVAMIPQLLESTPKSVTPVGMLVSGFLVGQGAEVLHKAVSTFLVKSPADALG